MLATPTFRRPRKAKAYHRIHILERIKMGSRGHSHMVKILPKSRFSNPRKSARGIAASAVRRIARAKADARSVSTPARIAARSIAVVGIADDQIKSARRLGSEEVGGGDKMGLCSDDEFLCKDYCCAVDRCYRTVCPCILLSIDVSQEDPTREWKQQRDEWLHSSLLVGQ